MNFKIKRIKLLNALSKTTKAVSIVVLYLYLQELSLIYMMIV